MFKTMIQMHHSIDIVKYCQLTLLMKAHEIVRDPPRKAKIFTIAEIEKFLNEAHDLNYLLLAAKVLRSTN